MVHAPWPDWKQDSRDEHSRAQGILNRLSYRAVIRTGSTRQRRSYGVTNSQKRLVRPAHTP
jgi:hypothetical protein